MTSGSARPATSRPRSRGTRGWRSCGSARGRGSRTSAAAPSGSWQPSGRARAGSTRRTGDVLIFGEVAEANRRLRLRFLARHESVQGQARSYAARSRRAAEGLRRRLQCRAARVGGRERRPGDRAGGPVRRRPPEAGGREAPAPVRAHAGRPRCGPARQPRASLALAASVLGEQTGESGLARRGGRRLSRRPGGQNARARPARLGDDPEQPRQRAPHARRARGRHRSARRGGRRLSRRPGGQNARARPARLGHDPEQPRQRAQDARRARGRHRSARRGGRRLSRRPGGQNARARPARLGHDPEQPRHRARTLGEREDGTGRLEEAVAAYRAALEVRTRERVPLDGPRPRTTSAPRSGRSASARTAPLGSKRRSPPIAPPWRSERASASRSTGP